MAKILITLFFLFFVHFNITSEKDTIDLTFTSGACVTGDEDSDLFSKMCEAKQINPEAFKQAMVGYRALSSLAKREVLALVDFSLPSTEERLFVFDMKQFKLLYSSYVAHGKKSGENYASSFSNKRGSYKSSLGFYLTGSTYNGGNGYSLILNGLEKGINDNAKERAIVVHGADYCDPTRITSCGRLGRSLGCPALPRAINKQIIDAIKGGSLLFIYAHQPDYLRESTILNGSCLF